MPTATKTKTSKKAPTISVVISTFSGWQGDFTEKTLRDCTIDRFKPIEHSEYVLRGGTPLLQATAQFIGHLESMREKGTVVMGCLVDESLSMHGNERAVVGGLNEFVGGMEGIEVDPEADGKVLAVIFTDGEENSSTEVSSEDVAKMIANKEDDGWTFIYLGANQDAWDHGGRMGFSGASSGATVNFVSTPQGTSSSLRAARGMTESYLSSNAAYMANASSGSISEDGEFSAENTAAPNVPQPETVTSSYDVTDAIKKAKGE